MQNTITWDGSEASTLLIVRALGDDVADNDTVRDRFSDYCLRVREEGITHPRLGNRVLRVGDTLTLDSLIGSPEPTVIERMALKRGEYMRLAGIQFDNDLEGFTQHVEDMKSFKFNYRDRVLFNLEGKEILGFVIGVSNPTRQEGEEVIYQVGSVVDNEYHLLPESELTRTLKKPHRSDGTCPAVARIFGDNLEVAVDLWVTDATPVEQYGPLRDLNANWVIVNPDDIDNLPMVLLHVGYDLSGMAMLTHETCEEDRGYLVNPSEILRKATVEEILSDTPNYD